MYKFIRRNIIGCNHKFNGDPFNQKTGLKWKSQESAIIF